MNRTPYRQVVRGTHTATRFAFPSSRVPFTASLWPEARGHRSASMLSQPSALHTAASSASLARPASALSSRHVPPRRSLRAWHGVPDLPSVSARRPAPNAHGESWTCTSLPAPVTLADEEVELQRWRTIALAQARLVVQSVQEKRRARLYQHLLAVVRAYQKATQCATALGLACSERRAFRMGHTALAEATAALRRARHEATTTQLAREDTLCDPDEAASITQEDVIALFREETWSLLSEAARQSPSIPWAQPLNGGEEKEEEHDPYFLLSVLFDAAFSVPSRSGETDHAHHTASADVTADARECFDWLVRTASCELPRDVYTALWVRIVSTSCAAHSVVPHTLTAPRALPDPALAHWELTSMKALVKLFPGPAAPVTSTATAAALDLSSDLFSHEGEEPRRVLRSQMDSLCQETRDSVTQLNDALDEDWSRLVRIDSLQTDPALVAAQAPSITAKISLDVSGDAQPQRQDVRVLLEDVARRARDVQQRLFISTPRPSGHTATSTDAVLERFGDAVVAAVDRVVNLADTDAAELAEQDVVDVSWGATAVSALCAWARQKRKLVCAGASLEGRHELPRTSWYASYDLLQRASCGDRLARTNTEACAEKNVRLPDPADPRLDMLLLKAVLALLSVPRPCLLHLDAPGTLSRLLQLAAVVHTGASSADREQLVERAYGLVWESEDAHTSKTDPHLYTALLALLLQHGPSSTRGHVFRVVWCFSCLLRTSPLAAQGYLIRTLDAMAVSPLPHSERAMMSLALARAAAANGLNVSEAATHVAMQRALILAPQPSGGAVLPTSSRRPSWLRRQPRWSLPADWFQDWSRQTKRAAMHSQHAETGEMCLLQSSIRFCLAMGEVTEATALAVRLPSVLALQRTPLFSAMDSARVAERVASLHALLFFCAMTSSPQCAHTAKQVATALLAIAPAAIKRHCRETWQNWYRQAAGTDKHGRSATPQTQTAPQFSKDATAVTVCVDAMGTPARLVNALLRCPFESGPHALLAQPAPAWRGKETSSSTTRFPLDAPFLHMDLLSLDAATREHLEREADLCFSLDAANVSQPSHWSRLCASPIARGTVEKVRSSSASPPTTPTPSVKPSSRRSTESVAVNTQFLAASAALRNHPKRT